MNCKTVVDGPTELRGEYRLVRLSHNEQFFYLELNRTPTDLLLEVKLPYKPVCPSDGRLVSWLFGWCVSHNFHDFHAPIGELFLSVCLCVNLLTKAKDFDPKVNKIYSLSQLVGHKKR